MSTLNYAAVWDILIMDEKLVEKILKYQRSGAKLLFRQKNEDVQRLKVRYGPARMFTKRFDIDNETVQILQQHLRKSFKHGHDL